MSELEVQAIIGRKVWSGKVLYLTKWKDFSEEEATWETIKVLRKVKHLIKAYSQQQKKTHDPHGKNNAKNIGEIYLHKQFVGKQSPEKQVKKFYRLSEEEYLIEYADESLQKMGYGELMGRYPEQLGEFLSRQ